MVIGNWCRFVKVLCSLCWEVVSGVLVIYNDGLLEVVFVIDKVRSENEQPKPFGS